MDVDNGPGFHPGFLLSNGSNGGPHFMTSDPSLSLEERLLRGQDDSVVFSTDEEKAKALEILGRTELGRKRAEEYFGQDVWNSNREDAFTSGAGMDEDDKDVDRMFQDLTNGDDDGDAKKERDNERDRVVTADSLEAERDALDMMDSD